MINPCHGCQRRSAECHADCTDYAAWNALHRAARDKDVQRRAADVVNVQGRTRTKEKSRRRTKQ